MRILLQRVAHAQVVVEGEPRGQIQQGLLLLVGIETTDTNEDLDWLCKKVTSLRIFSDEAGKMNHSVLDVDGEILLVSQFTLHANVKKGTRPSFVRAAPPDIAVPLYEQMIEQLEQLLGKPIATGVFGAHMEVHLLNDGPVTIWLDSKERAY